MAFNAKLFKKILGIAGAVILVLIVGVFFSPEADFRPGRMRLWSTPLADKNKNSQVFVSSADIQGVSDEVIVQDNLEADNTGGFDSEILHSNQNVNKSESNNDKGFYKVVKVIDGDTIVVDIGDKNETVRLIGIDAPEIGGGSSEKKCFGKESEEFAKKILSDANVYLEMDASQNDRDKYNRLLRYAIMENGDNFNEQMIRGGLAREYTYKTPYKYQKEFRRAEQEAQSLKIGLWGSCAKSRINSDERSDRTQNIQQIGTESVSKDCYCESNKYNCPVFKTHFEAQKVFECCMAKVGKDVHKLDGNNDGQVCESLP